MTELFGIDIAAVMYDAMQDQLQSMTLTRTIPGTYDESTDTYSSETTETYNCEGIVEDFSMYERANSTVDANDRKILLLANSIKRTTDNAQTAPQPQDVITTPDGTALTVDRILMRDPAGAVYQLQGRV